MKFNPFSFSKINTFLFCPMKFKLSYIDKIRVKNSNIALEKGSYIHQRLEDHSNSIALTNFNFRLSTREQILEFDNIVDTFINSELGMKYLTPTTFGVELDFALLLEDKKLRATNYYNKEALIRGKIDHAIQNGNVMTLLDWKSGRVRDEPDVLQVVVYALWCFITYPEIETVQAAFVYVEHGEEKSFTFHRDSIEQLQGAVLRNIAKVEVAEDYPKKESNLCQWCDYRKNGYCTAETGQEFADKMMNLTKPDFSKKAEWFFYCHPESGCAFSQKWELPEGAGDGLVEAIDEVTFLKMKAKPKEWEVYENVPVPDDYVAPTREKF